jgi:hypothetical protein
MEGAREIGGNMAQGGKLFPSAVDALAGAITFKGVMFGNGTATKLVLGCLVGFTTDSTDNSVLRMMAALHRVAKGPTSSALLYQRKRVELRDANLAPEHEDRGLGKTGGNRPIGVKERKCDRAVSGIGRDVGL